MKELDLEYLEEYLEKRNNQLKLIRLTAKNPDSPVDAASRLWQELQKCRDEHRDKLLDILVQEAAERARAEHDDGR